MCACAPRSARPRTHEDRRFLPPLPPCLPKRATPTPTTVKRVAVGVGACYRNGEHSEDPTAALDTAQIQRPTVARKVLHG